MCGIVGFIGREEAAPILLDGLSRLEYRGYDSAGLALYGEQAGLQVAKAKVQEITPVFTVVQPSTVPLAPSKPSKMLIIVGCMFLAFVAASAWTLFGRDMMATLRSARNKE